ncbi:fused MFS transporter/spermidine synthase family protein [Zavarzinella formosa]|uniref:hypothetical protein n=1 Tax=Zavarzinella formosa TaxID=360055 RepID=UPI0002EB1180|nr:hypothetical protein [Zavarzinella formosa]
MPTLFGVTMFISATLLFLVQPMVGKMLLPLLGGTPAVWNTCMVFFQALLLAGYYYAHKITAGFSPAKQVTVHLLVIGLAIAVLMIGAAMSDNASPVPIAKSLAPQGSEIPFFGVIAVLGLAIGLPFFVVSTTAPLLQKWFSETGHPSAKDPYFLYAASNAGSLLALVAYPFVVEPNLKLVQQAWLWAVGFILLGGMIFKCGTVLKQTAAPVESEATGQKMDDNDPAPSWATWLRWLILAAVPSSLMLSLTTEVTTDIVSIPMIWIVPLGLYLITFIIVFSKQYTPSVHLAVSLITPVLILLVVFMRTAQHIPNTYAGPSFRTTLAIQAFMFFMITMTCHGELARIRPSTKYLTNFYLTMSFGGMIGGLFNALVAPIAFTFISEYPLTLIAACMVLPRLSELTGDKKKIDEDKDENYGLAPRTALAKSDIVALIVLPLIFFAIARLMSGFYPEVVDLCHWVIKQTGIVLNAYTAATILAFGVPTLATYFLVERPLRFGLCVAALFLGVFVTFLKNERDDDDFKTVYTRSFFGSLKVEGSHTYVRMELDTPQLERKQLSFIRLVHGTTLHGKQRMLQVSLAEGLLPLASDDPWAILAASAVAEKQWRKPGREPLTYYHQTGPVGVMFDEFYEKIKQPNANSDVACIGLGSGSLSSYGLPGQKMTFFEIDNHVRRLVEPPKYFTYLDQAKKQKVDIDFLMGDARLTLEKQPADRKWGFMLVDAFSSDSIPAHLLTKESVALYFSHLEPNGICALHISNRYLNLEPVVDKIVRDGNYAARVMHDSVHRDEEYLTGKTSSTWIAVARNEESLGRLMDDPRWKLLEVDPKVSIWTDDFTPIKNILQGDWDIFGNLFGK